MRGMHHQRQRGKANGSHRHKVFLGVVGGLLEDVRRDRVRVSSAIDQCVAIGRAAGCRQAAYGANRPGAVVHHHRLA